MKRVEVDVANRVARAEGGCTLADFDAATTALGLATTMGTAPPTGIAGLTLGGGIGWLMSRHGLACDNLIGAEVQTADGRRVRVGNVRHLLPGPADTYMSYELPWANASNTPFRLYKHWVHEGGIATPFIAHWPTTGGRMRPEGVRGSGGGGVIPAGGIAHGPCHVIDLMPTCLAAAGVPYPSERDGRPVTPLEGESLLPLFRGDPGWTRDRALCWEHVGNRAVRPGQWKLVSKFPGGWELYDMQRDRTELDDLSVAHPNTARELEALYDAWAARCGVIPWDQLRPTRRR